MGYICIHGHFYQPPRENPWLEAVELQESAHPYHDWNERITAECYARNAASRILDDEKRIVRIVNNYSKISFNFGPTLISWLEAKHPAIYAAIIDADKESQKNFSGHGSALAQPYNHMIMPLANARDRHTQAVWGLWDFEQRFGRKPEGMWLPETAVDLATLEVLAELGIRFTILAPNQAQKIRKIGGRNWKDVSNGRIDPTMVYRLRLPSGRTISLFFYDGPISRALAFEGLLDNGEGFAKRLLGAFSEETRPWPELVHIATDGETYGHHRRFGEMALAYALNYIESNQLADITNYGEYLERHPPTHEVQIFENSSWSCVHGVERWRSNCGCNSGGHPGWNQEWRAPLREALDWLRDELSPRCQEKAHGLLRDLWAARNDYIQVVLDRSDETLQRFLENHTEHPLNEEEKVTVLKLLEIQRHAMLMYTSCGWFFDELSGLETVQVIEYAGRAVQLSQEVLEDQTETQFLERLSKAKSNIPEYQNGAVVYDKFVKPAFVSLRKLGGHYAIRSLFEPYEGATRIYSYAVERQAVSNLCQDDGREKKVLVGRARFTSTVTRESDLLCFVALHAGDYNPMGAARHLEGDNAYEGLVRDLQDALSREDVPELVRLIHSTFDGEPYTLSVLFRDDQQRILNRMVEKEWSEAEVAFRRIYPHVISVLRALAKTGAVLPVPRAFSAISEFALNTQLQHAFAGEEMDLQMIGTLIQDANAAKINLDTPTLEYSLRLNLERMAERLKAQPENLEMIKRLESMVDVARSLPFEVNLWTMQNICYELLKSVFDSYQSRAGEGDEAAKIWVNHFRSLAEKLSLFVA
jgi:alpha-amylase/alpha-mannosidase (GH57 family)